MIAKMTIACLAMLALVGTSMGALDALQSVKASAQLDHSGRQLKGIDGCPGANTPPGVYINSQGYDCQTRNVQNNADPSPPSSPSPSGGAGPQSPPQSPGGNPGSTGSAMTGTNTQSPPPSIKFNPNNYNGGKTMTNSATNSNHGSVNTGRKLLEAA